MNYELSKNNWFLDKWILRNIINLKYQKPTLIQETAIPYIIKEKGNFIGISKTGTGKTAAFCLPILNNLAKDPKSVYAIILEPTRELALQVIEKLNVFTLGFNLRTSLIIGGDDYIKQLLDLDKYPHIIVSTPGRLADLLENDKINLIDNIKYLVLDEFDQLFNSTMMPKIINISKKLPQNDRVNLLFSATYDSIKFNFELIAKVLNINVDNTTDYSNIFKIFYSYENMDNSNNNNNISTFSTNNNLCLDSNNAVKCSNSLQENITNEELNFIEKTVSNLNQNYITVPPTLKEVYLFELLNNICKNKIVIIFVQTCKNCAFLYELIKLFDFKVSSIHSRISQKTRFSDLNKFKSRKTNILVATDLACRGLDIPNVDYVINYDLPRDATDYIHRVGRTARAGSKGNCVSFITPYDVDLILNIENYINKKLSELEEFNEDKAMKLLSTILKGKKMIQLKLNDDKRLQKNNKINLKYNKIDKAST